MADQDKGQGLSIGELQILLMTSQAMSQEQDEERICYWVCDAATSLLGASLASIILTPTDPDILGTVYGKLGDSPLPELVAKEMAEFARTEWPDSRMAGRLATLQGERLPPGLTRRGINGLVRVDVRTTQQELGVLLVGKEAPWDLESRDQFVLSTLANETVLALENVRLRREATEQAQALRALIQASPLGIIAQDGDANVQMWNPAAEHIFGWSEQEVLGRPYPLVPEEKRDEFRMNLERSLRGESLIGLETRCQRKDGAQIDVGIWTGPLSDGGAMVVIADITERKRSEEALRESEEKFRKIFDNSNDAIILIDLERDKILDVNPKACDMLGFSRQELLSLGISAIHPGEMPELRAFAQSVLETGQGWTSELTCRTKTGAILQAEISASTVEIGGETRMISLVRDTTERKRTEETLLQQTKELAIVEERNRLAREIHDTLAQGLTAILWQLNAGERAVEAGGQEALEYLERVRNLAREGLREARRSVWDLRAGPLEGRTLAEALDQEIKSAATGAEVETSFVVSGEEKVLPPGVEAVLLRICQEALTNVHKYAKATQLSVTLTFDDSQVRLAVQDNGIGFDPEIPATRGLNSSGFGLINMRERARLVGGELTVHSDMGQGTIVEATLSLK